MLWDGVLSIEQVRSEGGWFFAGWTLLRNVILVILLGEEDAALSKVDLVEHYLDQAIERDDLWVYSDIGQHGLGRCNRLKALTVVRWLKSREFDLVQYRVACEMAREWYEKVFSRPDWRKTGFDLHQWMADLILLGESDEAVDCYRRFSKKTVFKKWKTPTQEDLLLEVADYLRNPGDESKYQKAEQAMEQFYQQEMYWPSAGPHYVEKLIYAYLRGKCFKNEHDPIRLIQRMKLAE